MSIPHVPETRFARPPLKQVIAQIRFPPSEEFKKPFTLWKFAEAIKEDYPNSRDENQEVLQIDANKKMAPRVDQVRRFSDSSDGWSVVLGLESLTLEARTYSTSQEMLRRFGHILAAGQSALSLNERYRLGLRYINEIKHPEARSLREWRRFLRPEFLGFAAEIFEATEPVEHMVQEVRVTRPDGTFVVRHGLLRGDSVATPPQGTTSPAQAEPYYLLDLDYWDERRVQLDPVSTQAQLQAFSVHIHSFFRWTLTDESIKYMEPQP